MFFRSTTASSIMPRRRNSSATATGWSHTSRASPATPRSCAAFLRSATGAGSSSGRSAAGRKQRHAARRGRAGRDAMGRPRSLAGGILLNLMPCVFPILALKALHLSHGRRERVRGAARRARLMRQARSSGPACSASPCSRSARRERKPAGRSSCRTRARSCSCCCSRSRSPPTCSALFELPVLGGRTRPAGSFGTGALGRLHRDALRRTIPRRGARHRAAAAARRIGAGVRRARSWPRRCRSCWSPSFPRCEASCRSPVRG